MTKSLSYYIILFILKIKGVKKNFSCDPIDYKKIRKGDVKKPKHTFFRGKIASNFTILNSSITEIKQNKNATKLLIFIHGGAFISGPSQHHWDTILNISKNTKHTIWVCNYPKAPENKISTIAKNIDFIYRKALEKHSSKHISLLGDSVGGTLITTLIQRLITKKIELPNLIILVSPVMDATMSNSKIDEIDSIDPMLSKVGVLSAKKMCAENGDLQNEKISPINGSFNGFPKTILFLAEHDITYPDQQLAIQKLIANKVNIEVIIGKNMPHIWPFLPVMKEAKLALKQIINRLNKQE